MLGRKKVWNFGED